MKNLTILIAMLMATSAWSQNSDQLSEDHSAIYEGYSYTTDGCSAGSYDFWIEFDLSDKSDGYDPSFISFKKSSNKYYKTFDTRFGGYHGMERICIDPTLKIVSLNFDQKVYKENDSYMCKGKHAQSGRYSACKSYFLRLPSNEVVLDNMLLCLLTLCTANIAGEDARYTKFSAAELYRAVKDLDLIKEVELLEKEVKQSELDQNLIKEERKQRQVDLKLKKEKERNKKADEIKRLEEELLNRLREKQEIIQERLVNRSGAGIASNSLLDYFSDTQKFLGSEVSQPPYLEIKSDIQVNGLRIRTSQDVSAKCIAGESLVIELDGSINPDTSEVIERLLKKMVPCQREELKYPDAIKIYLNSSGGYVEDGFKLGRMFRGFNVEVSILEGQECYSSCAFAFLGGLTRSMNKISSVIMFHAPYLPKADFASTGNVACSNMGTSLKDYFVEMIGTDSGEFLFKRTMSYCGADQGWYINKDAADIFEITNF